MNINQNMVLLKRKHKWEMPLVTILNEYQSKLFYIIIDEHYKFKKNITFYVLIISIYRFNNDKSHNKLFSKYTNFEKYFFFSIQ